ncbi:MAG: hypothetical protein MZU97_05305 [Bacillus subtilis]|nr:hypothetical protein [Bacillus subtilis]
MKDERQNQTPFYTKLREYAMSHPVPFDVPGHKLGRIPERHASISSECNLFRTRWRTLRSVSTP